METVGNSFIDPSLKFCPFKDVSTISFRRNFMFQATLKNPLRKYRGVLNGKVSYDATNRKFIANESFLLLESRVRKITNKGSIQVILHRFHRVFVGW